MMLSSIILQISRTVLIAGLLSLAGCSLFTGDDGRNDPAPLTTYTPGLSAQIGWKASIGSGSGSDLHQRS